MKIPRKFVSTDWKNSLDHSPEYYCEEAFRKAVKETSGCVGTRRIHSYTMDYLEQFMDNYRKDSKFVIVSFAAGLDESSLKLNAMDEDLKDLLKNLEKSGHLNETAVFIASEQGKSVGNFFTSTKNGKIDHKRPGIEI